MKFWRDENLILNYANFWSQQFQPYKVPAASEETIRNIEYCLKSCTPRIERERPIHESAAILESLQKLVDTMRTDKEHRLQINKLLYRNAPRMGAADFKVVSDEERARLHHECRDKVYYNIILQLTFHRLH